MIVVGLIIVGVVHTNWQAPAVGDPSSLPANGGTIELLWYCGKANTTASSPPMEKAILMRWLRG